MLHNRRSLASAIFFVVLTPFADAAQISPHDRENILAACAQTHDTCLQSCNAGHPVGGGFTSDVDLQLCWGGCNGAYYACTASVDRKRSIIKDKTKNLDNLQNLTPE